MREWITASRRTVQIMANVITASIHTIVHVIQDLLGQIVNTLFVPIMGVSMVQRVSMETLAIHVNVLMVFMEIIVKHEIIVLLICVTDMEFVYIIK